MGAHYDGLGASCRDLDPADTICNGATDNATGVAAALAVARAFALSPTPPRRSLVFAFWDREEDGLLGSRHFLANPLVPLEDVVTYVNFDIQGANLRASLRDVTFAIGAETGGQRLQDMVAAATAPSTLDDRAFSHVFGQGRSDHAPFIAAGIPTVFFSDSTGPCYHTDMDDPEIVDHPKLGAADRHGAPPRAGSGQHSGAALVPDRATVGDLRRRGHARRGRQPVRRDRRPATRRPDRCPRPP